MNTLTLSSFIQAEDVLELTLVHPSQKDKILHFTTSISSLNSNDFTVYLPPQAHRFCHEFEENQEIKCVLRKKKSIWSFRTRLIEITNQEGCFMKLALPTSLEQVQRRKHVRINHETDVQVDLLMKGFSSNKEASPTSLLLKSITFSPVGIKLLAPFQLENESLARLTFNIHYTDKKEIFQKTHSVLAKVIYSFCPEDIPSTKPILIHRDLINRKHIVAFRFLDLSEVEEKELFKACLYLETQKKSKDYTSRLEIQSLI